MNKVKNLIGSVLAVVLLLGCSKEVEDPDPTPIPNPYTKVTFEFTMNVDGATLQKDSVQYENALLNIYGVTNLQFLVGTFRLDSWNNPDKVYITEYHLFDLSDASTWTFTPKDTIKIDDYQNLTLFLGFDEKRNKTGDYPDLDDKGWGWSPNRGGGYYTLKMFGNYYSNGSSTVTNGYDLAIGGNIKVETAVDTTWQPNPIYASMTEGFQIPEGTKEVKIEIRMDLNKLFKNQFEIGNYNLDVYQTNIEEDAVGSAILSDNLQNCFRLGSITIDDQVVPQ